MGIAVFSAFRYFKMRRRAEVDTLIERPRLCMPGLWPGISITSTIHTNATRRERE